MFESLTNISGVVAGSKESGHALDSFVNLVNAVKDAGRNIGTLATSVGENLNASLPTLQNGIAQGI